MAKAKFERTKPVSYTHLVRKFLDRRKTGNVIVVNIKRFVIKVLSATAVV